MNSGRRREAAPSASRGRGTTGIGIEPEETRLPVGELAHDVRQEKRGIVMDRQDGFVWLRPEGGGTEWTALPGRPGAVRAAMCRRRPASSSPGACPIAVEPPSRPGGGRGVRGFGMRP